ncbi:hypothetical protein niasHS_009171 [Heterodera schachtii]|uniref:Uncharacterized protein n=1 Tax=Heterodera schachtii TaxID=97005 RepID=A0ABD2JE22_HETSC
MPALTTPMNGTAERQQRHFWLPNELIHELLLWVRPSYFWRVRQMLTTSAILCPLLMGGKNAITWHQPYDVWEKEASFADRKFGQFERKALLCRTHSNSLPTDFFNYLTRANGPITFYAILVLDETKFASPSHFTRARQGFDATGSCSGTGVGVVSSSFKHLPDEGFDIIKLKCDPKENLGVIMCTLLTLLKKFANYLDVTLPDHIRGEDV